MKKKILSIIIAATMGLTLVGFVAPTQSAQAASTSASTSVSQTLKITGYTADRYLYPNSEYPGYAKVGDNIHIKFQAEGGEGKIKYSYSAVPRYGQYIETINVDNLDEGDFVWTPTAASLYQINIKATDEAGNEAYECLHYSIGEAKTINVDLDGDYLNHPSESIQGYAVVGQDINLSASSEDIYSSFGRTFTYEIRALAHNTTEVVTTTDGNYTWTPTGEDCYEITVTAEDCYGNKGTKTVYYTISHPLNLEKFTINSSTTSALYITSEAASSGIELEAVANGGALAGYRFNYKIIPDKSLGLATSNVSTTTGKYTFTPHKEGHYLVLVTVKDEQGTTVQGSKEIFVR